VKTYSTTSATTIYMTLPQGPLVTGRVKEVTGTDASPASVHPDESHEWHEMGHFGRYGTGFAECRCGAIGAMFDRPEDDGSTQPELVP